MKPGATRAPARLARIGAAFAVLLLCLPLVQIVRGYRWERQVAQPRTGPVSIPGDAATLGLTPFHTSAGNARIAGWFVRPRGGGTIVMCHGNSADRTSLLNEARALLAAGHGIVLFDWPGHGESTGVMELGEPAQLALQAVLNATMKLPGVDSSRVGLFAFSFGGVTATRGAARDTRVRSLVLVATPLDLETPVDQRIGTRLRLQGGLLFWRVQGSPLGALSIAGVAPLLAPRPVLVIAGEADPVVPPAQAALLASLIGRSVELLLLPGAEHGNYFLLHPEYGAHIAAFFTRTLGQSPV
ncbi:MAG: alpha/beta fold hydrolase [Phycisphaerae bacterium]|nr:alpha/beta fold hydrolase [Gemmatimonadaceae bacterium]